MKILDVSEDWVRTIYKCHFKIAYVEKNFGAHANNQAKQIILVSVRGVVYFQRRTGQTFATKWFKRCPEKHHIITRLHKITPKDVRCVDQR